MMHIEISMIHQWEIKSVVVKMRFYEKKLSDSGKIAHVLKHSYILCVVMELYIFFMKVTYVLDTEQLYYSFNPNQYLFAWYIMEVSLMKDIPKHKTEQDTLMMMEVVLYQNN